MYGRLSMPWQDTEICSRWAARSVMMSAQAAPNCLLFVRARDTDRGAAGLRVQCFFGTAEVFNLKI